MEKSIWIERVKNGILHRVKEERDILHTVKRRKSNWVGNILRRNCLLKYVIEGILEWVGRRRRRRKHVLDYFMGKRIYCNLKKKAPYRTVWRMRFERGGGPVRGRLRNE